MSHVFMVIEIQIRINQRVHHHLLLVVARVYRVPILHMNPCLMISTMMSLLYVGVLIVVAHIAGHDGSAFHIRWLMVLLSKHHHLRSDIDLWYIYDLPLFDIGILKIKDWYIWCNPIIYVGIFTWWRGWLYYQWCTCLSHTARNSHLSVAARGFSTSSTSSIGGWDGWRSSVAYSFAGSSTDLWS